ncbi:uncharacterized protein ATNIH1004_006625 [Aspergillus tanneri]|uniref:Uncharacterized protein n=1 Tax=Aspergillus tanneri TaxID=1220188 RepID=A0A5M9MSR9_9EURO|nr:uncharacterized protein ATNIH1004_006625 [Aspergillus tanneri]KAA8647923.1 hypothetical protein ATNIH1004_006625 [Aspergillus tanneri]
MPSAPYSEVPLNQPRHRLSLARNSTPKSLSGETNTQLIGLEYQEGTTPNAGSENTGSGCGHQPQASHCDVRDACNMGLTPKNSIGDPAMTSWICKLSDINMQLHQHKLSIAAIEVEQVTGQRTSGPDSPQRDQKVAVDRTFNLSYQFTEILIDILSRPDTGVMTAPLELDQSSQLLVLSGYLCLVESYDQILQHIKTWTDIRLKMGVSISDEHFPIQLPSLAIGSFQLPTSSSTRPLVLMCIIEAMIVQIRDQVSETMRPINNRNGPTRNSDGHGLSGVTKVTLDAIRVQEDSTMKLLHEVWRHALRCGVP